MEVQQAKFTIHGLVFHNVLLKYGEVVAEGDTAAAGR